MNDIIMAMLIIGFIGLFIGLFLGIAFLKFKVEVDEREEGILGVLPGNNCGGCGYAGCSGLATAIVKGEAKTNACPVGGDEIAAMIAEIMGIEAETKKRQVAYVKCAGTKEKVKQDYDYVGIEDCSMLSFVPNGGPKACNYGCLGYGTCAKKCPFNAIDIIDGVAVVRKEDCKACGICVGICPKGIIEFVDYDSKAIVTCHSKDKGATVSKICQVGCIGCGICVKNCPQEAISLTDFLATIDPEKCNGCGICKEKCPKKCIE